MKKFKHVITVTLVALIAATLTACSILPGSSKYKSKEDHASAVVTEFVQALAAGDLEKAMTYTTDAYTEELEFFYDLIPDDEAYEGISDTGRAINAAYKDKINGLLTKVFSDEELAIASATVDTLNPDRVHVIVNHTCKDTSLLEILRKAKLDEPTDTEVQEYQAVLGDPAAELDYLLKYYDSKLENYYNQALSDLENATFNAYLTAVTVECEGNTCLISNMDNFHPNTEINIDAN